MKHCGIYCFTHIESGKKYVGSSIDINSRKAAHIRAAKGNRGCSFHRQMIQLGIENFAFEILELCEVAVMAERETYWIEYYDTVENGFNVMPRGWGPHEQSEAVRAKIASKARQEHRLKASSDHAKALHQDPGFKEKWAQAARDLHKDPEFVKKLRETGKQWMESGVGKAHMSARAKKLHENPEYTAANIERMKEMNQDPEFQRKRIEALRLKHQDPEWIENNKIAALRKANDPEFRRKCKEANDKARLDPSYQEKITAGIRRSLAENPEIREAKAELMRKRNSDPAFKAKLAENRRLRKLAKENEINRKDSVDLFS